MKKKLFKLALITSPVLAAYGIMPLFIFNSMTYRHIGAAFVFLSALIILFWLFNICLLDKVRSDPSRYMISFAFITFIHGITIFFIPPVADQIERVNFWGYPFIGSLATLAINTLILVMINSVLLGHKKDLAESEIQKLKVGNLEAQRQVLLQQLQPHFLFNALSTLKSQIRENPGEAEEYVVKLSEFLRYSIQEHSSELVPLRKELQFTADYLELQKARFGQALDWDIQVPELAKNRLLPVFALQTLVENAIKHNAFTTRKPLFVAIALEDNRLRVSNNRIPKSLILKSGMGLVNLQERYKLVSGSQPAIVTDEHQFTVFLTLLDP
jgi:sensor histidine kinase YesM